MALDFVEHLRIETARLGNVLRAADPAAPVPTCPEWSADDLLWHMCGGVFYFWEAIVRNRVTDDTGAEEVDARTPERPADHSGLMDLYERAREALIASLEQVGDDEPIWTWSSDHTGGFIKRRMAQEALIHRVDAEATVAELSPVDAALATDGILEGLQYFWGGTPSWATWTPDGPIGRLHTTDTGARWSFRLGWVAGTSPGGTRYEHEPALELVDSGEPSFTVSAPAADLDLWLWNRPAGTEPAVEGSAADFERLKEVIGSGV
ncbi:MAG TPA: maleylpyruvate isomerase family mycothiol-dependent enzyme [Jatrophihabitans sp.]|nr:maleylpyruvate isomerase family mycothiol-dependent enzyme [Jatrophihabitans sp.]